MTEVSTENKKEKQLKKELEDVNTRLAKMLFSIKNPIKDTTNDFYNSKYETLESVLDIVKEAVKKHGFYLQQNCNLISGADGRPNYCLQTTLFDIKTNERVLSDTRPLNFSSNAQKDGSYETYMRRYSLRTMFGMAATDDDGNQTTQESPLVEEARVVWKQALDAGIEQKDLMQVLTAFGGQLPNNDRDLAQVINMIREMIQLTGDVNNNIMGVM